MAPLDTTGIRCLPLGQLPCWQMTSHDVNKLARAPEDGINTPGKGPHLLEQCHFPCHWGAEQLPQASEDASCPESPTNSHSSIIENQEFLSGRAQSSWGKTHLSKKQKPQKQCPKTLVKTEPRQLLPGVDTLSCISHHNNALHKRDKAHSSGDCGKVIFPVSPSTQHHVYIERRVYQCSKGQEALTDRPNHELHQPVLVGEKSPVRSTHEGTPIQQSVHPGKKQ